MNNENTENQSTADIGNSGNEENNDMGTGSGASESEHSSSEVLREAVDGAGTHDSETALNQASKPFGFQNFVLKREQREKTCFYASDFYKADLDLYFSLTKEPVTNEMKWDDTIRMEAGNGVETALVKVLKDSGFVDETYEQQKISIVREGVEIHGKIDAILKTGEPVEIKSINNKNVYDILNYNQGKPKENYVGQLAIYMDALGKDTGYLFAVSLDGLNKFLMPCYKTAEGKYRCGTVEVDIYAEYKRWAKLWNENIVPKTMPDAFQYIYKPDIEKIDWKKVLLAKRRAAVNDGVVVGSDWHITYSPWADKIVRLQGHSQRGYTDAEKARIKEILLKLFK